ncbi:MAG: hypothetical protein JWP91_4205 [Fibrobacteres bacterium]|nr:hypothetical protein [Fibrobacterota bacterium]
MDPIRSLREEVADGHGEGDQGRIGRREIRLGGGMAKLAVAMLLTVLMVVLGACDMQETEGQKQEPRQEQRPEEAGFHATDLGDMGGKIH